MPMHDWTRVPAGLFHDFHQSWSIRIKDALNAGRLPTGVSALVAQRNPPRASALGGGVSVKERPVTQIVRHNDSFFYSERANRVVVKHHLGEIIAVVDVLSPGVKDGCGALRCFVRKAVAFLREGVHVLIVDLFPPTPRDPFGFHKLIWDEFAEADFAFPQGKDRILASYESGLEMAAYVEPVTVGDVLPDMPLFLWNECHVPTPLELTYMATWEASPEGMRTAVETGLMPDNEAE